MGGVGVTASWTATLQKVGADCAARCAVAAGAGVSGSTHEIARRASAVPRRVEREVVPRGTGSCSVVRVAEVC